MPYNDKYILEFDTLKTANKATLYYKVVFSELEDVEETYPLVSMTGSNAPFVLTYRSAEDFAFYPIKTSFAEINIFYPPNASNDLPKPETFFLNSNSLSWRVQLYEMTDNGATDTLKWQGFLVTDDIQYAWQDEYYYRLTATDNLGVLKDVKYSRTGRYAMKDYEVLNGVSLKDYIIEIMNETGNDIAYQFACNLKYDNAVQSFADIYTSRFASLNFKSSTPKNLHELIFKLAQTLGCIVYQSNENARWTFLNINEIATSTDNQVPYEAYSSEGTFFESDVLSFGATIERGGTYRWCDKNQIVTLKRPYGMVNFLYPFHPKNLLTDYSFQDDLGTITTSAGWNVNGTYDAKVEQELVVYNSFDLNYDNYIGTLEEIEPITDPVSYSDYLFNQIDLSDTDMASNISNGSYAVYLALDVRFQLGAEASDNFGMQVLMDSGAFGQLFWGETAPTYNIGEWTDVTTQYTRIKNTNSGQPVRLSWITPFLASEGILSVAIRFLKYRKPLASTADGFHLDNLRMNLVNIGHMRLKKVGVIARNNLVTPGRFTELIIDDCLFLSGSAKDSWWLFEDCIGVQVGSPAYIQSNRTWCRAWETIVDEESVDARMIPELTCRSILSFYRANTRKIDGSVYGEDLSYPKYFAVEAMTQLQFGYSIWDLYHATVEEDETGTAEAETCVANFLNSISGDANFLMVEGKFDYRSSKTLVNLHEDLTIPNEDFTSGPGGSVFDGSGEFGGGPTQTQEDVE